jgi:hypothetical protein
MVAGLHSQSYAIALFVATQYGYHIEAKFSEDSGNGKRVEGRACTVTFEKKR